MLENNKTEPFKTVEVFSDGFKLLFGDVAFELGGDLWGAPLAAAGAQQVADGGELFFGFGRPFC